LDVPADWSAPDGPTVSFAVKRVLATAQPALAQIWFLQGGPGGSVVDFEPTVEYLHAFDGTLDLYMPEHRGVGLSSRLSCPTEESAESDGGYAITPAERPACLDYLQATWGDRLAGFTTENAAHDLGETIGKLREPDDAVFVYGISYGSHWGNRYLQLYPDQASGVSLAALAVNYNFTGIDKDFNDLGQRFFQACADDPFCVGKLGPDPWARMSALMAALDEGHCPEAQALGVDRALVRQLSALLLYGWDDRTIIPPLVYRLERCDASDINAIAFLVDTLIQGNEAPPTASERYASSLLGDHIGLSEMWRAPFPSTQEIESFTASANVSLDAVSDFSSLYDLWPRYTANPELAGDVAQTSIPILLQMGALDFITSEDYQPVVDGLSGPFQNFVEYPLATHDPWSAVSSDGGACGLIDFYSFVLDPMATPQAACLEDVVPIDFAVDPLYANAYLGVADAWEGDPGPPSMLFAHSPDALQRAITSQMARSGRAYGR